MATIPVQSRPAQPTWARRVSQIATVVAVGGLVLVAAMQLGLIGWSAVADSVGSPLDRLANPWIGPRMVRLLGGISAGALAVQVGCAALRWPRLRAIVGTGLIVMVRRLLALVWLAIAAAAYLLTRVDGALLGAQFALPSGPIFLSVVNLAFLVLVCLTFFPAMPHLDAPLLPRPLRRLPALALALMALGIVVALDGIVAPQPRPWVHLGSPLTQVAIVAFEGYWLLLIAEVALAEWRDVRRAAQSVPARRLITAFAAGRGGARLLGLVWPLGCGLWLAWGATLPAASLILDRNGDLLAVQYAAGDYRLPVGRAAIAPAFLRALEATEDPGLLADPTTHVPVGPLRVVGILAAASQEGAGGSGLAGGSGIAAQGCKAFSSRPLIALAARVPAGTPGRALPIYAAYLLEKGFEMPCGWAFERAARLAPVDRGPLVYHANAVYFGRGAYGVEAAARTLFGVPAADLTTGQAALLAGLVQAPSAYDPWQHPAAARERRGGVLRAMVRSGYLTRAEAAALDAAPLGVAPAPLAPPRETERFVERALDELEARGITGLSRRGLVVTTTLDLAEQRAAEADARRAVARLGDRGVNDAATLVLDPRSGAIRVWVGGFGPLRGPAAEIDLVAAYRHEPGSTIKPLLYACALEAGVLEPGSLLDDAQGTIGGVTIGNADLRSLGPRPAALQLAGSRNAAAALLAQRLTPPGFADCLRTRFGLRTPVDAGMYGVTLGLGLAPLPMEDLARGYLALANGGARQEPFAIVSVADARGRVIYQADPAPGQRVVGCGTAAWVTATLGTVSAELGLPSALATKTGSTSSSSYIAGYGADRLLLAWVGRTIPGRGPQATNVDGAVGAFGLWRDYAVRRYLSTPRPTPRACAAPEGAESAAPTWGPFAAYWRTTGGAARHGRPISGVFVAQLEDGHPRAVQYTERSRLEWHPEIGPSGVVLAGQLGRAVAPAAALAAAQPLPGARYFPETGHNLSAGFRAWWETNGGVVAFGLPLTEERVEYLPDGRSATVQYFERARFEYHPLATGGGTVALSPLGIQLYNGQEAVGRGEAR